LATLVASPCDRQRVGPLGGTKARFNATRPPHSELYVGNTFSNWLDAAERAFATLR